jgi:lactobin A/cerein 7B family class IIb bacteriocin
MQTLDLANYGVQEMDTSEMKTVDGGGFLLGLIVGAVVGLIIGLAVVADGECPDQAN